MAYINVDEVFILDNTGLQVDMATDIPFKDASFTDTQKEQARKNIAAGGTNPNLLDNPWFTVNQRGQSSYGPSVYGVDRWFVTNNASINVLSNGIELTTTANRWGLEQRCVKNLIPHGTTVTFSALIDDGEIVQGSFVWNGSSVNLYPNGSAVGLEINTAPTAYDRWYVCNKVASTHTIHAVKIEIGSASTLANDTPPDYGTELLKCQRYFVRLKKLYSIVATGYALNATTPWFFAPTPAPLRDGVALTSAISGLYVAAPSGLRAVSAIAIQNSGTAYSASGVFFNATTTGLSSGEVCMLQVRDGNGYLDFSADL